MKTATPLPPAQPMSSHDAAPTISLRVLPWAIPIFGVLIVLMTGMVWAVVL